MIRILQNRDYARLFAAQVVALLGTGLLTVALGLLAYDLAGAAAGAVLGTAYAIKMLAYVGLAPVAAALAEKLPRKGLLIGADVIRAMVALMLPFIDALWQVYALIFVLQAASATFTPAFQAVIPEILTDEGDYTRALSLSRLAYDLENLISPALAGLLLSVMSYHWLFGGTVLGFVGSALLVAVVMFPPRGGAVQRSFAARLTRGVRIYLATPRLRGLLALNMAAAAAAAFVLVNSVVIVRVDFGLGEGELAGALAAFGAGSMVAALVLPRMLERLHDRWVMMVAGAALAGMSVLAGLVVMVAGWPGWAGFLALWAVIGLLYAAILTPSGRLLRRSAHAGDRPAVFAAQFALSHACWLLTYPLAGWLGQAAGMGVTLFVLGLVALGGVIVALRVWPTDEAGAVAHSHADLPRDHPHLREFGGAGGQHRHIVVIDDEHRVWPTHG